MEEGITIDYSPYFQSIEESLSGIQNNLSDYQDDIKSELAEIRTEIQSLDKESYFKDEGGDLFIPYANTSDIGNLLILIIVMLGMIFGALVFRHFRK